MAFTLDEKYLNDIALDSVTDARNYMEQVFPLMLEEAGLKQVRDMNRIDPQVKADLELKKGQLAKLDALDPTTLRELADTEYISSGPDLQRRQLESGNKVRAARAKLEQEIRGLEKTARGQYQTFEKTDERKAMEERFKRLEDIEMQRIEEQAAYQQSDEYKARVKAQQDLETQQQTLAKQQLDRQQAALRGEIGTSDVLNKRIADEFALFKEAQARKGNVILGDDPYTAVGKGSAAIESLRGFQDNAKAEKQREIDSIINQTPYAYQGLNMASGYTGAAGQMYAPGAYSGGNPGYTGALPNSPNYGATAGIAGAAGQPYQFDRNLQYQYDALHAAQQQRRRSSGVGGLIGTAAGMGLGALFAAPTGGMSMLAGAQAGGQLGYGLGSAF